MFYSHNILTQKGGSLGIVWIAANFQPGVHHISLTRREYCSVSIEKACEEVVSPCNLMALRLSANLMVGIVRIHRQQTHYTYIESKHVWQRIKNTYEKNRPTTDLPSGHTRSDAVTLPDPTSQVALNTTFPGLDCSFSLDSLLLTDLFSMSTSLPFHIPSTHPTENKVGGSPYTADPREISMEEETEAPLETLQIQVPGDGGDFGDGVLMECGDGPVVIVDNVPMPTLNASDSMSVVGGVGDYSSDSAGAGGGQQERVEGEEEGEGGEGKEGEMDSILLFDEKTDSFQLYKEDKGKGMNPEEGTPVLQPVQDGRPHQQPSQGQVACKRIRRKLAFDSLIRTKSSAIKENMNSAHTTLRDKNTLYCPLPARVKPATLLGWQPVCVASLKSPRLLSLWQCYQVPPDMTDQPEFELEPLESTAALPLTPHSVASIISDKEVARERSTSRLSSPGASAVELLRAGDDKTLDSHHTTGLTATFSDVSSFTSTRHHSSLGFETSSAQRQPSRLPLPAMDGLSPIADVDGETDGSFTTQHGDLGLPDLDGSYGSTPRPLLTHATGQLRDEENSPTIESEPLAYLSHISHKMGGRVQMEFQELLPNNCSRKMASRAFAHVLGLVTSQVLTVKQDKPYSTIILHRGDRF